VTDEQEIKLALNDLVDTYEDADSTYYMFEVPDTDINALNKGIVSFTIHINKMEGVAKLSQHHSTERKVAVIQKLEQIPRENEQEIAKLMRGNIKE